MNDENEKVEKIEEEAGTEEKVEGELSVKSEELRDENPSAAAGNSFSHFVTTPSGREPSTEETLPPQAVPLPFQGRQEPVERKQEEEKLKELREELEKMRGQVAKLEHERFLLGRGVPEEDLDYYAFKIEQLEGARENFAKAAKEYLKAHPVRRAAVSSGGELGAGGSRRPASSSELMNHLLRDQG